MNRKLISRDAPITADPYTEFLERKTIHAPACGLEVIPELPRFLKQFQRDIVSWGLFKGRAAFFQGTGTGKAVELITWSDVITNQTQGEGLIFAPLGVTYELLKEAAKFGFMDISYAENEKSIKTRLTITNYERRDHFNFGRFVSVAADESGIIKSDSSETRKDMIEAIQPVRFRLACTATPAPNDWTELGNHSELLGVMTAKEMLAMYFVHEGSIRADEGVEEWRLKRHAVKAFWKWVASWAVVMRDPNEFGYDEPDYILPPLIKKQITVKSRTPPSKKGFFDISAKTLGERIKARSSTVDERVEAAVELIDADPNKPWLVWCQLNREADKLVSEITGAVNVQGSDDPKIKEKNLMGFSAGDFNILISKPRIAGFGLNYQHCWTMIFVGLNDSFEEVYQAVRRCWRFGQTREVTVYFIASDQEGNVVANIERKERDYEAMQSAMLEHMQDFCKRELKNAGRHMRIVQQAKQEMRIPTWL